MKTPRRILRSFLLLAFCLLSNHLAAQQAAFKYSAALPKVDSTGYYRITLQPVLTAKANYNLADIRIIDSEKQFVPYVKVGDLPAYNKSSFIVFPQVKTGDKTDTCTVYAVSNPTDMPIHELWISLKNTEVQRRITITGSDDMRRWFAITESISLGTATANDNKGLYRQSIVFPASSYHYLKLVINNEHKSPVNITQAGIYTYLPIKPDFAAIPSTFKQIDPVSHITHVYINFNEAYLINKLSFTVAVNNYFHRTVNVYQNDDKHTWLTSTTLSNESPEVNLSIKTRSLDIQIVNNDDRPLPVSKVQAFQTQQFIVAKLDTGKTYRLLFGDEKATAPKYDLQFFTEKIGTALPVINHQQIAPNPDYKIGPGKPGLNHTAVIWLCVGLAVIALSVLTINMAREMGKRA